MKVLSIVGLLLASGPLAWASPVQAVPENYAQLPPSSRALIDATNLVVRAQDQPDQDWNMAEKFSAASTLTETG
jgi:hypothetical protein